MIKKLPKSFLEKKRTQVVNESKQDITPINWSEDVMSRKKIVKFIVPVKKNGRWNYV